MITHEQSNGIIVYQHTGILEGEELIIYSFSNDPEDTSQWLNLEQLKMLGLDE